MKAARLRPFPLWQVLFFPWLLRVLSRHTDPQGSAAVAAAPVAAEVLTAAIREGIRQVYKWHYKL